MDGLGLGLDFSIGSLFAGFVFGVFGMYLIKNGRKEAHIPDIVIGIVLLIYPYFVVNTYLLWGIGVGLLFLARRMG